MLELRDYQQQGVNGIRDCFRRRIRRVLYVLACGGGKSILTTYMALGSHQNGKRVLFHAHRKELAQNLAGALERWGVPHGRIEPKYDETDDIIQVARTKTLAGRIKRALEITDPVERAAALSRYQYDLVVTDEAHHAVPGNLWWYILEHNADAFHIGVTATPARLGGEPLGRTVGGWWDEMIVGPSVMDLIEHPLGPFLASPVVYLPDRDKLPNLSRVGKLGGDYKSGQLGEAMAAQNFVYGNAVEEYRKHCDGVPAIAYCVDIVNAHISRDLFAAAGYQAAVLTGKTPDGERDDMIADLAAGRLNLIASVETIAEGTDIPEVQAIIELRPTKSIVLATQMGGRPLRTSPGKIKAHLLDLVGNRLPEHHGFPTDEILWDLNAQPSKKKLRVSDIEEKAGRQCEQCYAWNPPRAVKCLSCGEDIKPGRQRELEFIEGELAAVDAVQVARVRRELRAEIEHIITSEQTTLNELESIGQKFGYRPGWATAQYKQNRNKWQGKRYGT